MSDHAAIRQVLRELSIPQPADAINDKSYLAW